MNGQMCMRSATLTPREQEGQGWQPYADLRASFQQPAVPFAKPGIRAPWSLTHSLFLNNDQSARPPGWPYRPNPIKWSSSQSAVPTPKRTPSARASPDTPDPFTGPPTPRAGARARKFTRHCRRRHPREMSLHTVTSRHMRARAPPVRAKLERAPLPPLAPPGNDSKP